MRIDKYNADIINTKEVYLHDDILTNFSFDRFTKILHLSMIKYGDSNGKSYSVDFYNVIGFEMSACDF